MTRRVARREILIAGGGALGRVAFGAGAWVAADGGAVANESAACAAEALAATIKARIGSNRFTGHPGCGRVSWSLGIRQVW